MSKIMPKAEIIESINEIIMDAQYKKDKARSPQSKRSAERALQFYGSIKYYIGDINP